MRLANSQVGDSYDQLVFANLLLDQCGLGLDFRSGPNPQCAWQIRRLAIRVDRLGCANLR